MTAAPTPFKPAQTVLHSVVTANPTLDVETYSGAGYEFNQQRKRYLPQIPTKPGLKGVGAAVYSEHHTADMLMFSYNLLQGKGTRLWVQGFMPDPDDLLQHIAEGGILESHNAGFEFFTWNNICHKRWGWPRIAIEQQRCSMAKAMAFGYPGALGKLSKILDTEEKKDSGGKNLIRVFCIPRSPTKHDKRHRIHLIDEPEKACRFGLYNIQDVDSEMSVSERLPDLSPFELKVWQTSQKINTRGVKVDVEALENCMSIYAQAEAKYTQELADITGGAVKTVGEIDKILAYVRGQGVSMDNLQAKTVTNALKDVFMPESASRVLEIRQLLSMASVKKLRAIFYRRCSDDRLRDLFRHFGATNTGRWSGMGAQPQNLASSGPPVVKCNHCGHHQTPGLDNCLWCGRWSGVLVAAEWSHAAAKDVLDIVRKRDLTLLEDYFGSPLKAISGCMRALFIAAPGYDLVCSDYSAIEAVCLAELAGETWRQELFRTHGKIYEMTASKITGIPFQEIVDYPKTHDGAKHPKRKPLGKIPELASGYAGWIGAWKAFGADKFFDTDEDIRDAILRWRKDNPNIVEFWGGQWRETSKYKFRQEYYGIEGAAVLAVLNPGQCYACRSIKFQVKNDTLFCMLPSGRALTYHSPRVDTHVRNKDPKRGPIGAWVRAIDNYSKNPIFQLSYMGWNSDSKKGPLGWARIQTYGGRLVENITQAVARDILAHAMVVAEAAGYRIVLHVHDELVAEMLKGVGSIAELEYLMGCLPEWCKYWPVKATGGWRGQEYRKD